VQFPAQTQHRDVGEVRRSGEVVEARSKIDSARSGRSTSPLASMTTPPESKRISSNCPPSYHVTAYSDPLLRSQSSGCRWGGNTGYWRRWSLRGKSGNRLPECCEVLNQGIPTHCPPRGSHTVNAFRSTYNLQPTAGALQRFFYSVSSMAVRVIRIIKQITRDNAFDWTVTALKTVSDVSPIPPLTAATNVVLSILQIVSVSVYLSCLFQAYLLLCYPSSHRTIRMSRLTGRAASGLLSGPWTCLCSFKLAWKESKMPPSPSWMTSMSSKGECCALSSLWDRIVPLIIPSYFCFLRTLSSIYEYMCRLSQMNRIRRGLEKAKIQDELMQHEQKLSRAERRFQVRRSISYFFFIGSV
jgi:hypothetical protein